MRLTPDRTILTVTQEGGLWAVELGGSFFGHSLHKEEARAAANRRARQIQDEGGACQVCIRGEQGFWRAP